MAKTRCRYRRSMIAFGVLCSILFLAPTCLLSADQPSINDVKDINKQETAERTSALPKQWNSYRLSLESLIGTYVVLFPDTSSPTGYGIKILDRALTSEGLSAIKKQAIDGGQPIYQSRVDSSYAGNLSFLLGSIVVKKDYIYDLCLSDAAVAFIPPDSSYTDQAKASNILARLPSTFKDLVWVTSVTHRTLAYKEYTKYTGRTELAYTLVKVGADYYYGNETLSVDHNIFFAGLSDAGLFGELDASTGLYKRRENIATGNISGLQHADPSEEILNLIRSTIKAGRFENSMEP